MQISFRSHSCRAAARSRGRSRDCRCHWAPRRHPCGNTGERDARWLQEETRINEAVQLVSIWLPTLHRLGQHARLGAEGAAAHAILAAWQRGYAIRGAYAADEQPIAGAATGGRAAVRTTTTAHQSGHRIVRVAAYGESTRAIVLQIGARVVLNAAEVALVAYADAVVLIGELSPGHRVVVEAAHTPTDGCEVLQAALIRTADAAAVDLADAHAPQTRKTGAGYHGQHNGIALPQASVNVHCEKSAYDK